MMERALRVAAIAAFAFAVTLELTFAPAVAQEAAAERAIRQIVADQAAAWTAGDPAGYTSRVAGDVSCTNLFGMVMYGKPAFDARHQEIQQDAIDRLDLEELERVFAIPREDRLVPFVAELRREFMQIRETVVHGEDALGTEEARQPTWRG